MYNSIELNETFSECEFWGAVGKKRVDIQSVIILPINKKVVAILTTSGKKLY